MEIEKKSLTEIVLIVLQENAVGKPRKITKRDLLSYVRRRAGSAGRSLTERSLRKIIETLRTEDEQGAKICSTMENGGGYYIALNMVELKEYLESEERRAVSILRKIREQTKTAKVVLSGDRQLKLYPEIKGDR